MTDHISDYLFAPTEIAKRNLIKEGIYEEKIFVTGNTIVDAVLQNIEIVKKKVDILNKLDLNRKNYFLVTAHREENVDVNDRLKGIVKGLEKLSTEFEVPIIFPMHPRTKKRLKSFNLWQKVNNIKNIKIIDPIGFLELLMLESNAILILTDSGGIQEESCILHVPCVTLRDNTERPETLEVGSNMLVGTNPDRILNGVKKMLSIRCNWDNPFGEGNAGERIVEILTKAEFH